MTEESPMTEEKISAPASHWKRRARLAPFPQDRAARQGDIAQLAFRLLGKDAAIAFLNTDHPELGGQPLAVATADAAGAARVQAILQGLAAETPEDVPKAAVG